MLAQFFEQSFQSAVSSPGRILGVVLFFATGVIWLIGEQKKKREREAKKLGKEQKADKKDS